MFDHVLGSPPKSNVAEHIPLHDFAGAGAGVGPELAAWIDRGVNAGMDMVADDGAELAASGIHQAALHHRAMVLPVMPEIGNDGAGAEVDRLT